MLKSILNVKGAQELDKKEQGSINGGYIMYPETNDGCPWNMCRNSFGRCTLFCS